VTHYIDVGSVLRRTVCDLYSNLVTRPTGAAVRREIETFLSAVDAPSLTVIDFSQVGLLDFSCADEVIGKLVSSVRTANAPGETYLLVRGVRDDHLEAIESAMARYDEALLVEQPDGQVLVVGTLDDSRRRVLTAVLRRGRAGPADLAADMEEPADQLTPVLDDLWARRLVMRDAEAYVSLSHVA
jgi:hypothetical protein